MLKIKKNLCLFLIATSMLIAACVGAVMSAGVAYADTNSQTNKDVYKNFLYYTGSKQFYYGDIVYDTYVGPNDIETFEIYYLQTKSETKTQNIWLNNIVFTLTTPGGNSYTATLPYERCAYINCHQTSTSLSQMCPYHNTDRSCTLFTNSVLDVEGQYKLSVSGNIESGATVTQNASLTFIYDKTPPRGTLYGVNNGGYTNQDVKFMWVGYANDGEVTATLNGEPYENGELITEDGDYEIVLTDSAGNFTKYSFHINKKPPVGKLNGVSDGGYTNTDVNMTWSQGYVTATLNGNSYLSGQNISAEGTYEIVLTDRFSNSSTYTFVIDKTPPVGMLAGVDNGGYTNGSSVKFTWETNSDTVTLNDQNYSSGTAITAEGKYEIVITDLANNSTTYSFTIDRTAPVGELNGAVNGEYTNTDVYFTWFDSEATAQLNGRDYSSGDLITSDGFYSIYLVDRAHNSSSYSFTLDKTPPKIQEFDAFTNKEFTLRAEDNICGVKCWEYRHNSDELLRSFDDHITIKGVEQSNGAWYARVLDQLDNASEWVEVNLACRQTFGNKQQIYNAFTTPAYYTVSLSQKNYAACYGTYTFADYDSALAFTTAKEWECRVIELSGENAWNYVTPTNENARQIYDDIDTLKSVIDKYARKNISERKVIGKNGVSFTNPTDADGATYEDALVMQLQELPIALQEYAQLPFMLGKANYMLNSPTKLAPRNNVSIKAQLLYDGVALRDETPIQLQYGTKLGTLVDFTGEQGWYLITESDLCGNLERYLVCIDIQEPQLIGQVVTGNGESTEIDFNRNFIDNNANAMRYLSFAVQSVMDNSDLFVMLEIDGKGISSRYVWGEELPILCYENGYSGKYSISAYDRSGNAIGFDIYIAGEAPTLSYSSLTNETQCRFEIHINDSFNEIADIQLYKVLYDGELVRINEDSYGTPVNAHSLEYRMTVGGKYQFVFSDLYGRVVSTEPLFYMKGLPTAILKGVKDGGLTNKDVSIIYAIDNSVELYVLNGKNWDSTDNYITNNGPSEITVNIAASAATSAIYKALLYVTADKNLYTEYFFEIDAVPPVAEVFACGGENISYDSVTTDNFYVTWQESGYKCYYKKQGSISEARYVKDSIISIAGTYVFTFIDAANNELVFTLTLDNSVSYVLDGSYTLLDDGSFITRNNFIFTLVEPWSVFNVKASNGMGVVNGQKLDEDGTYEVYVVDMYGNELALTLIVDKVPPVPIVVTEDGKKLDVLRTRNPFKVACDEPVTIVYSFGDSKYAAYDGSLLNEVGKYTFKLTDVGTNSTVIDVVIDRNIDITVEGDYKMRDSEYWSRQWLRVIPKETTAVFTVEGENGDLYDINKRISKEGRYFVYVEDIAGNSISIVLVISKTVESLYFETESGLALISDDTTREAFKVIFNAENTKVKYSLNNSDDIAYESGILTEVGVYLFTAEDFLGNTNYYRITINRSVSVTVNGNYVIDDAGNYISRSWLSVSGNEPMTELYVLSDSGVRYDADQRLNVEGVYTLYATDIYGNSLVQKLIIDLTPPTVTLDGVSVEGVTKEAVCANFHDYSVAYFKKDSDEKKLVEDKTTFMLEGYYTLFVSDLVGNSISVSFTIDKHVDVSSSVELSEGQIITGAISFKFGEVVTAVLSHNGVDGNYLRGAISEVGEYVLTVTDSIGNVKMFNWTILPAKAKSYDIEVPSTAVVSGLRNDVTVILQQNSDRIALTDNGKYALTFKTVSNEWSVEVEVDNTAPTLNVEKNKRRIVISQPNKQGLTYELYRDGKLTSFNLSSNQTAELTATGNYVLICTDEVGNSTEYTFELDYLNTAAIVLIVVGCVAAIGGATLLVVIRFHRKKY